MYVKWMSYWIIPDKVYMHKPVEYRRTGHHTRRTDARSHWLRICRFRVHMGNDTSSWCTHKNGLPQGSVLAPTLFNLYTNDLPILLVRTFIYADDICCATKAETFAELECTLTADLARLSQYCQQWRLKPSVLKTVASVFHLCNTSANRQLNAQQLTEAPHSMHTLFSVCSLRDDNVITSKNCWKLKHANSILESSEYFWQISSKSIHIISSYAVSKLGRFWDTVYDRQQGRQSVMLSWGGDHALTFKLQRQQAAERVCVCARACVHVDVI